MISNPIIHPITLSIPDTTETKQYSQFSLRDEYIHELVVNRVYS